MTHLPREPPRAKPFAWLKPPRRSSPRQVSVRYATEHRCGVVLHGPGLCDRISGTDPLRDGLPLRVSAPLDGSPAALRGPLPHPPARPLFLSRANLLVVCESVGGSVTHFSRSVGGQGDMKRCCLAHNAVFVTPGGVGTASVLSDLGFSWSAA